MGRLLGPLLKEKQPQSQRWFCYKCINVPTSGGHLPTTFLCPPYPWGKPLLVVSLQLSSQTTETPLALHGHLSNHFFFNCSKKKKKKKKKTHSIPFTILTVSNHTV